MRLSSHDLKWLKRAAILSNRPLDSLLSRRSAGEPLQYIIGTQPFGPLDLRVRPPVLIPRPETEHWTIRLSESFSPSSRRPLKLLDLGTGTGCIPLLLCHLWPKGSVVAHGIDISPHAVQLANENAACCGISDSQFTAALSNFLSPNFPDAATIKPPYDILTSNPPYISWDEYLQLADEVVKYEDPKALFGGPSGLEFYHAIARLAALDGFLSRDGLIALEVGHNQADDVRDILHAVALKTDVWLDPWGKKRTVIARR